MGRVWCVAGDVCGWGVGVHVGDMGIVGVGCVRMCGGWEVRVWGRV